MPPVMQSGRTKPVPYTAADQMDDLILGPAPASEPPPYDPGQDTQGQQAQPNAIAPATPEAAASNPDASYAYATGQPTYDTGSAPPEQTAQSAYPPPAPPPTEPAPASVPYSTSEAGRSGGDPNYTTYTPSNTLPASPQAAAFAVDPRAHQQGAGMVTPEMQRQADDIIYGGAPKIPLPDRAPGITTEGAGFIPVAPQHGGAGLDVGFIPGENPFAGGAAEGAAERLRGKPRPTSRVIKSGPEGTTVVERMPDGTRVERPMGAPEPPPTEPIDANFVVAPSGIQPRGSSPATEPAPNRAQSPNLTWGQARGATPRASLSGEPVSLRTPPTEPAPAEANPLAPTYDSPGFSRPPARGRPGSAAPLDLGPVDYPVVDATARPPQPETRRVINTTGTGQTQAPRSSQQVGGAIEASQPARFVTENGETYNVFPDGSTQKNAAGAGVQGRSSNTYYVSPEVAQAMNTQGRPLTVAEGAQIANADMSSEPRVGLVPVEQVGQGQFRTGQPIASVERGRAPTVQPSRRVTPSQTTGGTAAPRSRSAVNPPNTITSPGVPQPVTSPAGGTTPASRTIPGVTPAPPPTASGGYGGRRIGSAKGGAVPPAAPAPRASLMGQVNSAVNAATGQATLPKKAAAAILAAGAAGIAGVASRGLPNVNIGGQQDYPDFVLRRQVNAPADTPIGVPGTGATPKAGYDTGDQVKRQAAIQQQIAKQGPVTVPGMGASPPPPPAKGADTTVPGAGSAAPASPPPPPAKGGFVPTKDYPYNPREQVNVLQPDGTVAKAPRGRAQQPAFSVADLDDQGNYQGVQPGVIASPAVLDRFERDGYFLFQLGAEADGTNSFDTLVSKGILTEKQRSVLENQPALVPKAWLDAIGFTPPASTVQNPIRSQLGNTDADTATATGGVPSQGSGGVSDSSTGGGESSTQGSARSSKSPGGSSGRASGGSTSRYNYGSGGGGGYGRSSGGYGGGSGGYGGGGDYGSDTWVAPATEPGTGGTFDNPIFDRYFAVRDSGWPFTNGEAGATADRSSGGRFLHSRRGRIKRGHVSTRRPSSRTGRSPSSSGRSGASHSGQMFTKMPNVPERA